MEKSALNSLSTKRGRRISSPLIRYAFVGMFINICGYAIYLLVTWLGVSPKVSMSFLYCFGAVLGFFGNRRWTFAHNGEIWHSWMRYWITHMIGYGLNFFMLYFFVDRMGYSHQMVQAAAVFIVAGFLFLMFNCFVFPKDRAAQTC